MSNDEDLGMIEDTMRFITRDALRLVAMLRNHIVNHGSPDPEWGIKPFGEAEETEDGKIKAGFDLYRKDNCGHLEFTIQLTGWGGVPPSPLETGEEGE